MLERRQRVRRAVASVVVALGGAVLLAGCGDKTGPDNKQNALRPAGPYAHQILNLFTPFFWLATVIGIGVVGATIYVALRFRVKPGEDRLPVQTHGHTALEISWTIIPALILAIMAVFTITDIFSLAKQPSGPGVLHVTVSARQWWWQFTYDDGTNIITANELHMPVNTPVALTLVGPPLCTAENGQNCYNNGVIHSFWIPELNGKKDVVPGRQQYLKLRANRVGTFRGQCAEYCGLSHADMRLRAVVQTADDFKAWQASQLQAKPKPVLLAGVNAEKWGCQTCHSFEPKVSGAVAPNLAKLADRQAFAGDIWDMTWENLWQWVYNAPSRKPMGNLTQHMPSFKGEGMTEPEAKQIACFLLENTATNPQPLPQTECPT